MVRPLVKYFVAMFIGLALIRLTFGQHLDRRFLIDFAVWVVVMLLVGLLLVFVGPHIISDREFFAAMGRRAKRLRGTNQRDS